jgi:hypothetical protein
MRSATFALFAGIAYLSAGLLGLVPAALLPPPADAPPMRLDLLYGYLLGLFPVNVLHSAAHIALGAWGVTAWRIGHLRGTMASPKTYARALAILYAALAVAGLAPALNTLFGLVPLHGHDVWLHAATAALAAYFGWRKEVWVERRVSGTPDRREQAMLVASDRRAGHADRRAPGSEV